MKTRLLVVLCAAVIAVSVLSGCGEKKSEQITLKFWHAQTNPDALEYFEAYTKTHPNIKIESTVFMDDDFKVQSRVALSNNETPDVWYTNTSSSLVQFVGAGGLADLSQYKSQKGWDKIYDATSLQCTSIGDKLYGLPWSTYTPWMVLWANRDFFQANNLQYPKTVDELIALAPKIRALGQEPLVFYNLDGWTGAIFFGEFMLQQVGPEWLDKTNAGQIKWTESAEARAALDVLKRLAERDVLLTGYETQRQDTALQVWKNKQSPLMYNGTWFTQNIGTEFDFAVDCIRLPLIEPGAVPKAYQNWLDWCLGICPNTKYFDEALDFITYAAGAGFFEITGNATGTLTPIPEVNKALKVPYYFQTEPILEQLDKPKTPFWCYGFATPVVTVLQDQIKLVMAGQTSINAALQAIDRIQAENIIPIP
jgi:raffinose/stachyose/melibiose transport system substrate-binding protein